MPLHRRCKAEFRRAAPPGPFDLKARENEAHFRSTAEAATPFTDLHNDRVLLMLGSNLCCDDAGVSSLGGWGWPNERLFLFAWHRHRP